MSKLKRGLRLASLATQLAGQEFSQKFFGQSETLTRINQAKRMTSALSELKGAAMKAGQLLSLDVGDLLPDEAREILSQLQGQARSLPIAELSDQFKDLPTGQGLRSFSEITQTAIAAASIGQVHQAMWQNQKLAVKVQYPGIRDAIDTDLRLLRSMADSFLKISGKEFSVEGTFAELRTVLEQETDFLQEAKKLERYGALLSTDRNYIVPKPIWDLTSPTVLTMTWVNGIPIRDWIKSSPSLQARNWVAHLLLQLFCYEFARFGFVQTDPNFANFLIQTDIDQEKPKLVCLDFGATLDYPIDFRKKYAELLKVLQTGSVTEIFNNAVSFGLLDPREPRETQIAFKELIRVSLEPFDSDKQPFDFQDKDFEKRTKEISLRFSRLLQFSPPPRQILFLHRKLGGVFNLVKSMRVSIDLRPYWEIMTTISVVESGNSL